MSTFGRKAPSEATTESSDEDRRCRICGRQEGNCLAVCQGCGGHMTHWDKDPGWLHCRRCSQYVKASDPAIGVQIPEE